MYNNIEDSDTDIKGRIVSVLKNEYTADLLKASKKKNMQIDLLNSNLGFADITVWFYNRNCPFALEEAKQIWEMLPKKSIRQVQYYGFSPCLFRTAHRQTQEIQQLSWKIQKNRKNCHSHI
jgi:hypothetical protein